MSLTVTLIFQSTDLKVLINMILESENWPQERLEGARELVEKKEVPCEVVAFKSFSPAEAIIDAATEYGCDLIFMALTVVKV